MFAEYFMSVAGQIAIMFLLIAVGYGMFKVGYLTERGIKDMSILLLKIVTPVILMTSFQREFQLTLFGKWSAMLGVAILSYAVSIVLARIVYRGKNSAESEMCIFLPNNGFLAFPLMQALAGEFGIFFGSTNVIMLNIVQWTYGLKLLKPEERISAKKIFINPGMIGVASGLLLFVSPWKLPPVIFSAGEYIASLNTPIAMIVLGGLLAQTDLKEAFKNIALYKLSAVKLLLVPLILMPVIALLPLDGNMKLVAFICSVTPSATAVSLMSQLFDGDYKYAATAVVTTTVISAITMPIILALGSMVI